eukprot:NODE_3775_length_1988_cov_5.161204.p1 GENE.NODE_3775_length_1988_cov_5.161204~~NODE_3775_length_1988_cov_5.161204.p1  ORF type:complete len:541 (+),score=188.98 NODE_3775_length_1988_cov_5.161204:92-1714(+)
MASSGRPAALLSYFLVMCVGLVITYLDAQVPRAPLPRDEVAALAAEVAAGGAATWPDRSLRLSTAPHMGLAADILEALAIDLAAALADEGVTVVVDAPPAALLAMPACIEEDGDEETCLSSLAGAAAADVLGTSYSILVAKASGPTTLLLSTGDDAVLRWHMATEAATIAAAVAERLRGTWFRRWRGAPLFEIVPSYVLSFSLVGDCRCRAAWDFASAVYEPHLRRFFDRLRLIFDFDVGSQVVQCGALGGGGERRAAGPPPSGVSAAALQDDFLRLAGEWPGDAVTRASAWLPPLVRLVAFRPSAPFEIIEASEPLHSFAIQGWGIVAVTDDAQNACAEEPAVPVPLSPRGAQSAASAWVSNLRSWLGLQPNAPLEAEAERHDDAQLRLRAARPAAHGIADWELRLVARAVYASFQLRTDETLTSVVALVDSLPQVAVRAELAMAASEAVAGARRAASLAAAGDLRGALRDARGALKQALAASVDEKVVAQLYFSWEFTYVVYLPLALPIFLPIFMGLRREWQGPPLHKKQEAEPQQVE